MAQARYGCTNRKNKVPIDALGGPRCSNSQTITRKELEDRVLACLSPAFLQMGIFEQLSAKVRQSQKAKIKARPAQSENLRAELRKVEQSQANIIQQISDRATEGRPRLSALDDRSDTLEERRVQLVESLATAPSDSGDIESRLAAMREEVNPEAVQRVVTTLWYYMRGKADTPTKQPFIAIMRQLVQKVVANKTPGRQPASLEVHGRIASILAAMDAATIMEERFKLLSSHDYLERLDAGELDTEVKRSKLLDAYAEELAEKRAEWADLQVSVVAGQDLNLLLYNETYGAIQEKL